MQEIFNCIRVLLSVHDTSNCDLAIELVRDLFHDKDLEIPQQDQKNFKKICEKILDQNSRIKENQLKRQKIISYINSCLKASIVTINNLQTGCIFQRPLVDTIKIVIGEGVEPKSNIYFPGKSNLIIEITKNQLIITRLNSQNTLFFYSETDNELENNKEYKTDSNTHIKVLECHTKDCCEFLVNNSKEKLNKVKNQFSYMAEFEIYFNNTWRIRPDKQNLWTEIQDNQISLQFLDNAQTKIRAVNNDLNLDHVFTIEIVKNN